MSKDYRCKGCLWWEESGQWCTKLDAHVGDLENKCGPVKFEEMMRNRHDCAYYDGGFCSKGLPGTLCEIKGCVAFYPKGKAKPELTWRDIKTIVALADRMLTGNTEEDAKRFPNEEAYYEKVLEEWRKGK